jgi:hypothetical protein
VVEVELLEGHQATLDGYVVGGEVEIVGVVDSIMFPGTLAFRRFEYPSALPGPVQTRMAQAATAVIRGLGFDHGYFDVEFMYNRRTDALHIIEVNPRVSSQFADLYEKVDGFNTYVGLLELALDRRPRTARRQGRYNVAASCLLRRFQDARVIKVPSPGDVERVRQLWPDVRIEVLAREDGRLSQELQDGSSYRYGLLNIGAQDRDEILRIFEWCRAALPFVFAEDDGRESDAGHVRDRAKRQAGQLICAQ